MPPVAELADHTLPGGGGGVRLVLRAHVGLFLHSCCVSRIRSGVVTEGKQFLGEYTHFAFTSGKVLDRRKKFKDAFEGSSFRELQSNPQ